MGKYCASMWRAYNALLCPRTQLRSQVRFLFSKPKGVKDDNKLEQKKKLNLPNDNLSAVLYGANDLRMEQRDMPKICPGEVLIAMDCAVISGSDLAFFQNGQFGKSVIEKPMILGKAGSGIIAKRDEQVKTLKVGDRVAIEPAVSCRKCHFCKIGRYNLCTDIKICATPPTDGIWTRYHKHPADFCYKIPDFLSMEEGALLNLLAHGVAACRRADVKLGSRILIVSASTVGLMVLLVAQIRGAFQTIVVDSRTDRLKVAKELGAMHIMDVCPGDPIDEIAKQVCARLASEPDIVINCNEYWPTVGFYSTKPGGNITYCGNNKISNEEMPLHLALEREVDIRSAVRCCNDFEPALRIASTGTLNIKRVVTHHYDLEDAPEAIEVCSDRTACLKVIIHMQPQNTNNKLPFTDPIIMEK